MARWITCPKCGRASYNPHDVEEEGYCGACHEWTNGPRSFDVPGMEDRVATIPEVPTPEVMWRVAQFLRKNDQEYDEGSP